MRSPEPNKSGQVHRANSGRRGRGLYILRIRKRHPSAFLSLVIFGVLSHTGALGLTAYAVSHGLAREANPVYYLLSNRIDFMLLGYAVLAILYLILWAVPMRPRLRLSLTALVSTVSAFDFAHDAYLIYYHQYIFDAWKNWLAYVL